MSELKVLALLADERRADAHWRIVRPFKRLCEKGYDAQWCWINESDDLPEKSVEGRIVVLQRTAVKNKRRSDVSRWIAQLRKNGALAVVYEADDDIWSPAYLDYLEACGRTSSFNRKKIEAEAQAQLWTMQACDAVTVTTPELAEVAQNYTDAPVHVVPNAIDIEWFRRRLIQTHYERENVTTIGWAGGRRPESDLEPMAIAWGRIAKKNPKVRFVVAGWLHDVIYRNVEDLDKIISIPWMELDDYPSSYCVNIGCAIAPDNAFSKCKSPIKAWEYALAGAVVVGTRTPYSECLIYGGLMGSTVEDWEYNLAFLLNSDNVDFRVSESRRLLKHVEKSHSLEANLHRWVEVYDEIRERRSASTYQLVNS